MTDFTFTMSREQADTLFQLIDAELQAHKNWIVTNVEEGNFDRAKELAGDVRKLQNLFAGFNISAKEDLARYRGAEMETSITIR